MNVTAAEFAKQFLEKMMSDKALREKMLGMTPEAVAETAKAQGFEVTAEELMAAREELRNGDSSVTALM